MNLTLFSTIKTLSVLLLFCPFFLFSQEQHPEHHIKTSTELYPDSSKNKIYDFPEIEAEFPGGSTEKMKFIIQNFLSPNSDQDESTYGRIIIGFIVNTDGTIEDIKILKGIGKVFDLEAVRMMKSMPNWIPAKNDGENVRSRIRLPLRIHP